LDAMITLTETILLLSTKISWHKYRRH